MQSQPMGTLILQIDGLSYHHLLAAAEMGYTPFLCDLVLGGRYKLEPYRSGLPSDTLAVQSIILYGENKLYPGYYWVDRATGNQRQCLSPTAMRQHEKQMQTGCKSIVAGGSSYSNFDAAGASAGNLTLSRLPSSLVAALRLLLEACCDPRKLATISREALSDTACGLRDWLAALAHGDAWDHTTLFSLVRLFWNAGLRNIVTWATMRDIERGTPVVYTNYISYDLVAHRWGPLSNEALRSLTEIDQSIAEIMAHLRDARHRYRTFILSDHGMQSSVTFEAVQGQRLERFINTLAVPDSPSSKGHNKEVMVKASGSIAHIYFGLIPAPK